MIGFSRAVVVIQVAGHAGRAGKVVIVIDVTLRALQRSVRSGERKAGVVVIERGIRPGDGVVALVAGLRETLLHVARVIGVIEIGEVTTDARSVRTGQVVVVVDVATRARS